MAIMNSKQWKRARALILAIGLLTIFAVVLFSPETRAILAEYQENVNLVYQIRSIDPQTPEDYYDALVKAMKLRKKMKSPFNPGVEEIADMLAQNPSVSVLGQEVKTYKPWATEELRNHYAFLIHADMRHGAYDSYSGWDDRTHQAFVVWFNPKPYFIRMISTLAIGGGLVGVLAGFLPLLVLLLLAGMYVSGVSALHSHIPASKSEQLIVDTKGGNDEQIILGTNDAPDPLSQVRDWPIDLDVSFVDLIEDKRSIFRMVSDMISRAPPTNLGGVR
ncbi:hypothetical protein ACFL04_00205 [Patescibacteria group bacterium]